MEQKEYVAISKGKTVVGTMKQLSEKLGISYPMIVQYRSKYGRIKVNGTVYEFDELYEGEYSE